MFRALTKEEQLKRIACMARRESLRDREAALSEQMARDPRRNNITGMIRRVCYGDDADPSYGTD